MVHDRINKRQVGLEDRFIILFIITAALFSYGRIFYLRDVFWDDNCWLLSIYATRDLKEFLNTGFVELRREPLGTFLYYVMVLHKNTDYAYQAWQLINIILQSASPVFLYLLIKNFTKDQTFLALLSALSLIVFPLDYTVPYLTAIGYRAGLLLSLISLYCTERAFSKERVNYIFYAAALASSGFTSYVLMEMAVVLEPARFLIIWYALKEKNIQHKGFLRKAIICWLPFGLLSMPLIAFKLFYKPYGIYQGIYRLNPRIFLEWGYYKNAILVVLQAQWVFLLKNINCVKMESFVLFVISSAAGALFFKRIRILYQMEVLHYEDKRSPSDLNEKQLYFLKKMILLGLSIAVPQVVMLGFAARTLKLGMDSSHAVLLQAGYAIIVGGLLYAAITVCSVRFKGLLVHYVLALILGLGVFFNNLNLDLFYSGWQRQVQFWQAFTKRFPSLPERADFLIDVNINDTQAIVNDVYTSYDLEFTLNLLYAKSKNPEGFRRFRVYPARDGIKEDWKNSDKVIFEKISHWGQDMLDSRNLVIVRYVNNEVLVNREIMERYPAVPYKKWLDKDLPVLPTGTDYPLRSKVSGLR